MVPQTKKFNIDPMATKPDKMYLLSSVMYKNYIPLSATASVTPDKKIAKKKGENETRKAFRVDLGKPGSYNN